MSRVFAYCRFASAEQTRDEQIREIAKAGFAVRSSRFVAEEVSSSVPASERQGFGKLLQKLKAGDVLVVSKLDRLGRNAIDVRATVDVLACLGVRVHCLALGPVDLTSATGQMTMRIITAVAEFERDLLIERTRAGLLRAKARGRKLGRPPALSPDQVAEVARRLSAGEAVAAIARAMGASRPTIMRARDAIAFR